MFLKTGTVLALNTKGNGKPITLFDHKPYLPFNAIITILPLGLFRRTKKMVWVCSFIRTGLATKVSSARASSTAGAR